jgi:LytR cell envelope-related transcriptional attenuator
MNWRRAGFVAVEVGLILAIPFVAAAGFRAVLNTTEGRAVDPELDPGEPGYEAFVEPTPTALLLGTDGPTLSWIAFAALGGEGARGGSLLLVPPGTHSVDPVGAGRTLAAVYAEDGLAAVEASTAAVLGTGVSEVVTVEPERLAGLVAPVSPLNVANPDDVEGFEAGDVALDGSGVVRFLGARDPGSSDLARLARHELLWRAWIDAVAASSNPDAVPGEAAAGVGRFVRGLAAGASTIEVIPVGEDADGTFVVDPVAVADLIEDRVPFPVAAFPGARPRVRVLDGVGAPGLAARVAREAVRAGGQVTVLGNADEFGATTSAIVYYDPAVSPSAEVLADALGTGPPERRTGPNPDDLVDLTVVAGTDLAAAYGLEAAVGPTISGDDAG